MQRHKKFIRPPPAPVSRGSLDGVYTPMPEDWVPPPPAPAMFTDVVGRVYAWQPAPPQPSDFDKLRYKYKNPDLWETLTEEIMDLMLNPPKTYDPAYQRKVNLAVLTSIKTLQNESNLKFKFARAATDTLDRRIGELERAVFAQSLG